MKQVAIVAAWLALVLILLGIARRAADRLTWEAPRVAWTRLRRLMRSYSAGALVLSLLLAVGLAASIWSPSKEGAALLTGGIAFTTGGLAAQTGIALALFPAFDQIRQRELTRTQFTFRLSMMVAPAVGPAGLTVAAIGAAAMSTQVGTQVGRLVAQGVAASLLIIWVLQWKFLKAALLPGRAVEFPMPDWEMDAKLLAKSMGVTLEDLLMLQTGKLRVGCAYSLPGRRIIISDDLLAVLTRDEFMAIMAHELAHFAQQTRRRIAFVAGLVLLVSLAVCLAIAVESAAIPPPIALSVVALLVFGGFCGLTWLRRSDEDEADRAAIERVGSRQLASGIAKCYAVNENSRDRSTSSVHRTLDNRLGWILSEGCLDPEAVQEILADAEASLASDAQVSFSRA